MNIKRIQMLILCIAAPGLSGCVAQLDYNYRAMQKTGSRVILVRVTDAAPAEIITLNREVAEMDRVSAQVAQ